ncbi:MAG: response regulator [Actinomycetota bacterium]|nr:response regulator [Actinomycetota bacterium]
MSEATVLVVDDDRVIQRLVCLNFEMKGYTVITAGDGLEGLMQARNERPDAVVLDVMMPMMDGFEVARALKADPDTASIPVVLLTARTKIDDMRQGRDAGADDYVTKPFDPTDLVQRVEGLLAR